MGSALRRTETSARKPTELLTDPVRDEWSGSSPRGMMGAGQYSFLTFKVKNSYIICYTLPIVLILLIHH